MQKIFPFLWFEKNNAEEAAEFYVSAFKDAKVLSSTPGPDGKPMVVMFQLEGQDFAALNGGPHHKFNNAISLYVNCRDQKEVDELWSKLTADGGQELPCGWLEDKFGVSWQIIPTVLPELMGDSDPEKVGRVVQALSQMKKIDVQALKEAYAGK